METIKLSIGNFNPTPKEVAQAELSRIERERQSLDIRNRIYHAEMELKLNKRKEASPITRTLKLPEGFSGKDLKRMKRIEKYIKMRRTR